jgi:hypothetical protein
MMGPPITAENFRELSRRHIFRYIFLGRAIHSTVVGLYLVTYLDFVCVLLYRGERLGDDLNKRRYDREYRSRPVAKLLMAK